MDAYAFTDLAGDSFLVVGPAGISWLPIEVAAQEAEDIFVVVGEVGAISFAAFLENERHARVWPVSLRKLMGAAANGRPSSGF